MNVYLFAGACLAVISVAIILHNAGPLSNFKLVRRIQGGKWVLVDQTIFSRTIEQRWHKYTPTLLTDLKKKAPAYDFDIIEEE